MSPESRDSLNRAEPGTSEYEQAKADLEAAIENWRENVADQVRLSSGVVLGLKAVPQAALRRAVAAVERPAPPKWLNPETNIEEDNPTHPEHLAAVDAYYVRIFEVTCNVLFALGTFCKSVPEGMFRPEEDDWIEELRVAGFEPDVASPPRRYKEWLDLYAVKRWNVDQGRLLAAVVVFSGYLLEPEVLEAINSFRGRALVDPAARVSKKAKGGNRAELRARLARGRSRDR